MENPDTLKIILINEEGKEYDNILLTFKKTRLRRITAKELKRKLAITNFAEFQDEGAIDPNNIKFKKVDFKAMTEAESDVEEELTWLLWGFPGEKKREDVSEPDFLLMLKRVQEEDPLGVKKNLSTVKEQGI